MAQDHDTATTIDRLSLLRSILVGVLAVLAALTAGHLIAGLLNPNASPFYAVGNSAIDLTPAPLKDFAVRNFGTNDKLVLLAGMAVVLLLVAAIAGIVSRRSPLPGVVVATLLGGLGIVAVLTRPDTDVIDVLAPLTSLVAGVGVFMWLHGVAFRTTTVDGSGRRQFLYTVAGIGIAGVSGQLLGGSVEDSRTAVGDLVPATPAPPIPAGADFPQLGTPRFLTSNRDFYRIDTQLDVPRLRAEDYVLRIHGAVEKQLMLRFADIRRMRLVERTITMTCVSNEVGGPYVSTSNFIGVPLRDVLAEAGVKPGAEQLFSTSVDGWTCGTPVADVLDRGLLAIGMNGEPLPAEHGFPARMVVPGLYGFVSATKWVVDMEFNKFADKQSYWLKRGWGRQAPIKTQSRIDSPSGFATVGPGRTTIAGVAWAQPRGIAKVEVRADNGPWVTAELAAEVSTSTWRMWRAELDLAPGLHTVDCRATDKTGYRQTEMRVPPIPDGATGWHSTTFTVQG
ncbi:DMSO/TMAO reductase YedYZ molybdopterin-dependent catalytic subunit [Kibdelosporangium banguiense]|uniref:DMSO/TMAO reductase YedYZ molybdopterin-dependent catalytic subunit n=1 Tax=Kibdelosporangium banguiense TaxID=1365924 RepID=A0ABS4TPM3_9PSEU|nr:molybdopterin-dependent oxidoreductase [Kibdelosporangium banguiense]MBP2325944.1 DMSO/TMAO reductase YedYZ molybdopterin-dependent catalytic subunit [Kibdelosporangium banguiense]